MVLSLKFSEKIFFKKFEIYSSYGYYLIFLYDIRKE